MASIREAVNFCLAEQDRIYQKVCSTILCISPVPTMKAHSSERVSGGKPRGPTCLHMVPSVISKPPSNPD